MEAAARLALSTRQVTRLAQKARKEGVAGLAQKLRGKEGNRVSPERLDGSMHIFLRGKELAFTVLPGRPAKIAGPKVTALSRAHTLAPDHPWRKKFLLTLRPNT